MLRVVAALRGFAVSVGAAVAVAACGGGGGAPSVRMFAASKADIVVGESLTLSWLVDDADTCTIAPDVGGVNARAGEVLVTPAADVVYTLTCRNAAGTDRATVAVMVTRNEVNGDFTLSGVVRFERVPSTINGLDYAAIASQPVRGVRIEVLRDSDDALLVATVSDATGAYQASWTGSNLVRVRAYASTPVPPIEVVDNTADGALYALDSQIVNLTLHDTADVLAVSGWDGSAVSGPRAAAPFAVLDSAYEAATQFLAERAVEFPPLVLNWSVNNRPESGAIATGAIGTSFWDGTALFILGQLDVDTDEYDADVIVHEWGHYFESKIARSDSIGGPHGFGDVLDARVAMSEGWGNALSGIIGYPDSIYTDSFGSGQASASGWDNDANTGSHDPQPGWFSESSVQSVVYDVWDPSDGAEDAFDGLDVGIGGIYDIMTGDFAEGAFLTSIFSWLHGVKTLFPALSAAADTLAATHNIAAVVDARGSGETNDGGVTDALPVYRDISIGGTVDVRLTAGMQFNTWAQNRYLTFVGAGGTVTVSTVTSGADVDLAIYEDGALIAVEDGFSGNEQATFTAASGRLYVIVVTGFASTGSGTYDVQVRLQ